MRGTQSYSNSWLGHRRPDSHVSRRHLTPAAKRLSNSKTKGIALHKTALRSDISHKFESLQGHPNFSPAGNKFRVPTDYLGFNNSLE